MAFLEGFASEDLGVFVEGEHFIGVQDASERFSQDINWRGAFGFRGPVLRSIRPADENTFRFSAVLLKSGVESGMNDEDTMLSMRDFECKVRRGRKTKTHKGCNWRDISIDYGQTEVMFNAEISIPGYTGIG